MENVTPENLAFRAFRNGRYADAIPTLSALADQDDVSALVALGWLNEVGVAGERNIELAKNFYQRAGDVGSVDAWYRLGRIFKKYNDLHAALVAFERGANQNYLPCISALGLLMIRTAQNQDQTREGMRWVTNAAERGHFFAKKKILDLKLENENSLVEMLKILAKLVCLGIGYQIERRRNKYSTKVL